MSEQTYYVALEGLEGEIAVLVDLTPEQFEGVKMLAAQIEADIDKAQGEIWDSVRITVERPAEPDDESTLQAVEDLRWRRDPQQRRDAIKEEHRLLDVQFDGTEIPFLYRPTLGESYGAVFVTAVDYLTLDGEPYKPTGRIRTAEEQP